MSDYFDRVERQIASRVQDGVPRPSRARITVGHLAVAAAVLVVIVVAGVFLAVGGGTPKTPAASTAPTAPTAPTAAPAPSIVFTPSTQATTGAMARTVEILRARLATAVPHARVQTAGGRIVVQAPDASRATRAEILALTVPGRIAFYDWEADALLPSGKSVASRLAAQDPAAVEISQGSGGAAPGGIGAGCVTVPQALALTAKLGAHQARPTEYVGGQALRVPTGFVVLQATDASTIDPGVYVLRNRPALPDGAITNPRRSADPNTHMPTVEFGFTASGSRAFQSLTAGVARRGSLVSNLGQTLNQHFAIALDNKLLTVPFIDYKQYPDGISGAQGAEIAGGLTKQSARNLAILLRYGPLPMRLTATG